MGQDALCFYFSDILGTDVEDNIYALTMTATPSCTYGDSQEYTNKFKTEERIARSMQHADYLTTASDR
jgi:hypothetical protein